MKKSQLLVPLLALLLQGCMTMTPYEPSYDNVQRLKQTPHLQSISYVQVKSNSDEGSISVRGTRIKSPSGSFPLHIQEAITEEFRRAGLLDPQAQRRLNVLLVQNDLNAGLQTGTGNLAAHFTLFKGSEVIYDATKDVSSQWESSFSGFIATQTAAKTYNPMVRNLLKALYSDPQFIQALE